MFKANSLLAKILNILFDIFSLSICFFLVSILLFTTGLSYSALYYAIDRYVLDNDPNSLSGFVKGIKENYKQAIPVYIIVFIFGLLIVWAMWIASQAIAAGDNMGRVVFSFGVIVLILFAGFICYLFPTLAIYKYNTKELFNTCFGLSIVHLPLTILFGIVLLLSIYLIYRYWILVTFLPAILVILQCLILRKIYLKHS